MEEKREHSNGGKERVVEVVLGAKQVERRRNAPHLQPPSGNQVHEVAYIRSKASCAAIKLPSKKWFVSLTHPPTRG